MCLKCLKLPCILTRAGLYVLKLKILVRETCSKGEDMCNKKKRTYYASVKMSMKCFITAFGCCQCLFFLFVFIFFSAHRILKAGKAVVYTDKPTAHAGVTHVFVKDRNKTLPNLGMPFHTLGYIAHHLFGVNSVPNNNNKC